MISKLIFNLRVIIRVLIGHYFPFYKVAFQAKKNNDKLLFSDNTDLVIEGFPRVGNTFFVLAFQERCLQDVKIAHHVHLTCQIKEAIKNNVPTIVLIRDPFNSILSLKIREPKILFSVAFTWYLIFYTYVLKNIHHLEIKEFATFTHDYSNISAHGFTFKKPKELNEEEIFKSISEINKRDTNKHTDDQFTISLPNNQKKKIKEMLQAEMSRDTYLAKKCKQVYEKIVARI